MRPTRIKGARGNSENDMRELVRNTAKKEWRQPVLRKLLIAATAGAKANSNEGMGTPKAGDSGTPNS
jgi:hypothetical protein